MKRCLLLACTIIFLSTISQAQITKGSILLGGSIGLSNGKSVTGNNNSRSTNVYINPTAGIAIKENWIVGISAGFSSYNEDPSVNYSYNREGESYSGGLFVRRYAALGKNFYLYGNGAINYSQADHTESSSPNYNPYYERYYNTKGVTLSLAPGIAYAINKRFHLEASLNDLVTFGYNTTDYRTITFNGSSISNTFTESKNFNFNTNFNASAPFAIGFRVVLGK